MTGASALALLAGTLAALGAHAQGLPGAGGWLIAPGLLCVLLPRLRPLAALCAGFLWAWWPLQQYDHARLSAAFDERVLVTAQIEGLPARRGADAFFTARLRPSRRGDLPADQLRAVLRWPDAPRLRAGERWQLLAALHAPPGSANPGSAALALQPLRMRLHAAGQVVASALNQPLAPSPPGLDVLRERIALAIAARIADRDAAALVIALAIGDTQRVSVEQWRVFNAVGITHLVAISGLHVTLFCLVVAWLAGQLWDRMCWLQARVPRHTCATLVGLAASFGYALLAGWSVPTQRTLLMLATWHGLRWAARPRPAARTLAAGLVGVLLLDPLAPLAAGFWLSFLAVGALLVQGALSPQPAEGWRALLHTQGWVMAALAPVTVAVFGSISVAGIGVNLLAIPVFSLLLVPLILAATLALALWPAFATLLFKLAALVIGVGWPWLHVAADSPLALWRVSPPPWWYAIAAIALAVALLPWRPWMRCTALLALLPAAYPASGRIARGTLTATVFDIGRGEAVLLHTAGHALLFDDGEAWGSGGGIAASVLVPALRYYNVHALDAVILPRLDADRGAGVLALAAALPVRTLLAGAPAELPPEFARCRTGAGWRWDGVGFEVLDGASCTLRVSVAGLTLVLAGTAAAAAARAPDTAPAATALVLAPARLRTWPGTAAPHWLILSAGARVADGANAAAALQTWRASGAQTFVTGVDGALELRFGPGAGARLSLWRRP